MKRIFISVGSASLEALTELVNRLCLENLFDKFADRYIAFDSDKSMVDSLNKIRDVRKTDRIQGYEMTIDPALDGTVQKSFQQGWSAEGAYPGGVGGDRTISGKAAEVIRAKLNPIIAGLDPDDHIIVAGSAFGGTSSGMFLNVCEYLDLQIRRKREVNTKFGNVQVLGFLQMPDSTPNTGNYPAALNMIDMFRDLQTISWQRRLESERPGFKVPAWSQYEDGYFPLFSKTMPGTHNIYDYGISGSTLPMGTLYLIPTPAGQGNQNSAKFLYAESLFVASYLRVDEGHGSWVNRTVNGTLGPATNLNVEDKCLAGFNMFAMRSGRMRSLKNWFAQGVISALRGQNGQGGLLSKVGADNVTQENIVYVLRKAQVPCKDADLAGIDPVPGSALQVLLGQLRNALQTRNAFSNFAAGIDAALTAVEAQAPQFEVLPAKALIALLGCSQYSGWNGNINFTLVKQAYNDFYSELMTEVQNVGTYRDDLIEKVGKAQQLIRNRVEHRVTKQLEQEQPVFREVAAAFEHAFKEALRLYLFACRCTKTAFLDPAIFNRETDAFETACNDIGEKFKKAGNLGNKNPYIAEGNLVDPLVLPTAAQSRLSFEPLKILLSAAFRREVTDAKENQKLLANIQAFGDTNDLLKDLTQDSNGLLMRAEEKAIADFVAVADSLPPASNPLSRATIADFDPAQHKTYASQLRVPDSGSYHYHFVIKQGPIPANFNLTNGHVGGTPLNLATMPNTAAGGVQFLSVPHNNTDEKDYWKDETTTKSPVFPGLRQGAAINVNGLWIGTLGTDFAVRDILNRIYAGVDNIRDQWVNAGNNSGAARRLLTTVEMIRFGLVIEAIEDKIRGAWQTRIANPIHAADRVNTYQNPVKVSFENPAKQPRVLPQELLGNIGFVDDPTSQLCKLTKISPAWTKAILDWIRDPGMDGFRCFYPNSTFATVGNTEANIFTDIRFSILPTEIQEMNRLKGQISASLRIAGL